MQPRCIASSARGTSSPISQLLNAKLVIRSPNSRRCYRATSRQCKAKGSSHAPAKPDFNRSPQASKQTPTISPSTSIDPTKAKSKASVVPPPPSLVPDSRSEIGFRPTSRITYLPKPRLKPSTSATKPQSVKQESSTPAPTPPSVTDTSSAAPQQRVPQQGALADNSIFAEESKSASEQTTDEPEQDAKAPESAKRDPSAYNAVLNPRPEIRALWQRKMVIRSIRRRGRLTKPEKLLRTERSSLSKSHFFKTSIKKLAPLARQIAGKPIDEAILQMRYSYKKAARDVLKHLKDAKNESVVRSGMGLGLDSGESESKKPLVPTSLNRIVSAHPPRALPAPPETNLFKVDPSRIYIAQAWVNRGPYGKEPEFRAQGRVNMLRPPTTGLSVLLKEERTRMREAREKQDKAERIRKKSVAMGDGGMWTAMPDRKIVGPQNQSVLW